MEKIKSYNFSKQEYKILENLADKIYNTCVILEYFCSTQREIEELYNISPIVQDLKQNSDILNSIFINSNSDED